MSLAELLKADLEDLEDQEDEAISNNDTNASGDVKPDVDELMQVEEVGLGSSNHRQQTGSGGIGGGGSKQSAANKSARESVKSIARLLDSERLNSVMTRIEFYHKQERSRDEIQGAVEQDPEYKLIVEANNITVEIDTEINIIHKYIRDKYSIRFPELESLVPNSLDYIKTVRELGNNVQKAKNNENLQKFLTTATIMIVSVSASTTQGQHLNEHELALVNEACDVAVSLDDIKTRIFQYVESRMTFIAPNLSLIVGASTAAKLMGVAGGLTNLSKMPACNILLLGQQKKTLSGFSTIQVLPHTGFIYYCDVVQNVPPDLRRKVARVVAGKCTLAARIDSFHQSREGTLGNDLRAGVNMRIEKLQEPPPVKQIKPLAVPLEQARKKRGGRRARKMKERLGITELRKQANRMTFGEIEEDAYQEDLSFSTGQMGKAGTGRIRAAQIDSKTKARISQKLSKTLQKQNQWGGGTSTVKRAVSGTASSVAFTSLQGLEIVNPNAAEKDASKNSAKYFSTNVGFSKLAGGTQTGQK